MNNKSQVLIALIVIILLSLLKGDGVSVDSQVLIKAVNSLPDGGTLTIPNKTYNLKNALSNIDRQAMASTSDNAGTSFTLSDFGAKGDGVSNDSQALIKAVNSLPAGGTLTIPNKTYNLNNAVLNITKPLVINGSGELDNLQIKISNAMDVQITGLKTRNVFLSMDHVTNIIIVNNQFKDVKADVKGFIALNAACKNVQIRDNDFSAIQYVSSSSTYGCGIKAEMYNTALSDITITGNTFSNIHGPAALWLGGSNTTFSKITIDGNYIHDTESFGIEFYQVNGGGLVFNDVIVNNNRIEDIGSARTTSTGSGCGGIYTNVGLPGQGILVTNNQINRVTEVGIEGYYGEVKNNYIEDTGSDQLNHPIGDNAGIYNGGNNVEGNTIVNPGNNGGIYYYNSGTISGGNYLNNTIKNEFQEWQASTSYSKGDVVVSNDNWYICSESGTSGEKGVDGKGSNIPDGTCQWNYKKPLADVGINLNGVKGLENITISNNTAVNIEKFTSLSGFNNNITIIDNRAFLTASISRRFSLINGYGNRICGGLKVGNNNIYMWNEDKMGS